MIQNDNNKTEKLLRIVSLEAHNVLRLKAVRIEPDPESPVVILGGDNAQGKSSVLACIEMAFRGARAIPEEPVRRGEPTGNFKISLGDLTIEREGKRLEKIVVRTADGTPQKSPQEILNKLFSEISFDPIAFERLEEKKQVEVLRKMLGLDFTELDQTRARLYEERTQVNRSIKVLETRIADFPRECVNAPDEEVHIGQLLTEHERLTAQNVRRGRIRMSVSDLQQTIQNLEDKANEAKAKLAIAQKALDECPEADLDIVNEKLSTAEMTNRLVRAKHSREKESKRCTELEREAAGMTKAIEAIDSQKQTLLEEAAWPVPELSIADGQVTYRGLPFSQASASERRRISFSIACALHPKLGVILLPDASLLDKTAMREIAEMAHERGYQVWIERVGDGDPGAVILEDGEVLDTSGNA